MKSVKKILIIVISIILITIIFISSKLLMKEIDNRIENNKKASIESEIQLVIDEVKQEVEEKEERSATLEDLKEKFLKLGYTLDNTTGKLQYNGYIVTINSELDISNIKQIETNAWYEISDISNGKYTILVIIENKKGIEKITSADITYELNGKKQIAFDKICEEGEVYQFKVKIVGESEEELYTMVASAKTKVIVQNSDKYKDGTTKTLKIEYPENPNLINYYSLDNGNTWQIYKEEIDVEILDDTCVLVKSDYNIGKTIYNYNDYIFGPTKEYGILAELGNFHETGNYTITENDINYPIHLYYFEGDQIWTENQTFGTSEDIGTSSTNAENTVVVKVNGNLTIEEGVTVTTYSTAYGGPKGFILYCTGILTNKGTISMTGKGGKAQGQNVYMYKNYTTENDNIPLEKPFDTLKHKLNEYEYIPASGGRGGSQIIKSASGVTETTNGNRGNNGVGRQTGRRRNRCWKKIWIFKLS